MQKQINNSKYFTKAVYEFLPRTRAGGGFLDLKGEALVGEINRRCGNNGVPVMG